ncbi:hypothetical protein HPB50_001578 [Hyalomma asiaticum]|uniref:Uncharacterized protein n=1 Tax=Hyalomma asiaticum TaxID=266040 RepID=A0ACB7SI89_HYAAI|nr:hypothetical protein HPB50_001578 [Hyalomma asiaticum]
MNVHRAVQIFSPEVAAALKLLREQAGHTSDITFAEAGATIEFMDTMHRWFLLMDVSNCVQNIHKNMPDCKQYESASDERLVWLTSSFLEYLEDLRRDCQPRQFLTKETYQALTLTTKSNVECTRYLLDVVSFKFVLTRKFSSDPIESFFGWLRRSAGSNDQTDVRAVLSGVEKALKTGIISASKTSNVVDSSSHDSDALKVASKENEVQTSQFPVEARELLQELLRSPASLLPTVDTAALAMVGGYVARVIQEKIACSSCISFVTKPASSSPIDSLIRHQDRGGLLYPSSELVNVLYALKKYTELILNKRRVMSRPLQETVSNAVSAMADTDVFKGVCTEHRLQFLELICIKFCKPVFTNYALGVTDKHDVRKALYHKPLSRKVLKL